MKELRGKNAILTGASRGIGPYIARALGGAGVNVALTARSESALHTLAQELTGLGIRAVAIPTDITDEGGRAALVEQAEAELGPIDILVNNAGIGPAKRFVRTPASEITQTIETNLTAPLLLTHRVLPGMLERKSGHIVNISSLGGKIGGPYATPYVATKAGLNGWSSGLYCELEGTGVSTSTLCLGTVAEVGIYASWRMPGPKMLGEISPDEVAQSVLRAIREDHMELLVTPKPFKPLLIIHAISPCLANVLGKRSGLFDYFRKVADQEEARVGESSQ